MYSNTMRYTGTSGIDVDSMVTQLMNAEKMKYDKVYRETELLKYTQEAYQTVGSKLSSIQKSNFDNLSTNANNYRKSSTWNNYITTIKDSSGNTSNAIGISFSSTAKSSNFSVRVDSVAKGEKITSIPAYTGIIVGEGSTATADDIMGNTYNVTVDGTTKKITFSADDLATYGVSGTASATELLAAKVNATFGEDAARFDTSSGTIMANEGHSFSMSQTGKSETNTSEDLTLSEFGFGTKTSVSTNITNNSTLQDVFGIADDGSTLNFSINGVNFSEFDANTTMKDLVNTVNNSGAGVTLSFSSASNAFSISSNSIGASGKIEFGGDYQSLFYDVEALRAQGETGTNGYQANSQAQIAYTDQYGITTNITRNTNSFTIDEINFTVNSVSETLNVSTENDTATTIDKIKAFVDTYNEMLEALYEQIDTSRPKSGSYSFYEPLTSDERDEMSETEQKNWDTSAKTGLLYNDSILKGIESSLREAIMSPITLEDGTKISLYDLGITTDKEWRQKGRLVIDEDKLKSGVEKYSGSIDELFTQAATDGKNAGIANKINTILDNAVGYSGSITEKAGLEVSVVSLTTNSMYEKIQSKEAELEDLLDYLADKEDHYYSIFSSMESYITQQNSQMSYLLSSLG